MPVAIDRDPDGAELRLQRLEYRYRRAQNALTGARALYGTLRQSPESTATQLHHALRQIAEVQLYLGDLESAIDLARNASHHSPQGHYGVVASSQQSASRPA
jgi:hypothetical protein